MLIYLDTCAVNRLFDKSANLTVRAQAVGIREVLRTLHDGTHSFLYSWALWWEVWNTPDRDRYALIMEQLPDHALFVGRGPDVLALAARCVERGLSALDAMHVSSAVVGGARLMFTTDSGILKFGRLKRSRVILQQLRVVDPVDWHKELEE